MSAPYAKAVADARRKALEEAALAALSARFGPPSMWQNGWPAPWHLKDRPPTPEEAAMHDNGCIDAAAAIRAPERQAMTINATKLAAALRDATENNEWQDALLEIADDLEGKYDEPDAQSQPGAADVVRKALELGRTHCANNSGHLRDACAKALAALDNLPPEKVIGWGIAESDGTLLWMRYSSHDEVSKSEALRPGRRIVKFVEAPKP